MNRDKKMIMEKPMRGREMKSQQFGVIGEGHKTTLMHEGFVGGHKYLVPDSELDVMKELVDYRLGKAPRDRYIRDYEYTKDNIEPDRRFQKMQERLKKGSMDSEEEEPVKDDQRDRKIKFADESGDEKDSDSEESSTTKESTSTKGSSSSTKGSTSTKASSNTRESSTTKPQQVRKSPTKSESEESSEKASSSSSSASPTPQKSPLTTTPSQSSSAVSSFRGTTQPFNILRAADVDRIRFLISGHFRSRLKPIFIFHEFTGISPFGARTPDFTTNKKEGDVDIYIRGIFFTETILEERDNELTGLMIKPNRILIDKRKDKIYELKFSELIRVGDSGVEIEGKYIKQSDTKKYTPFLAFNVMNIPKSDDSSKTPTVVYQTDALTQSIFHRVPEKQGIEGDHVQEKAVRREVRVDLPPVEPSRADVKIVHGAGNSLGSAKQDHRKSTVAEGRATVNRPANNVISVFQCDIPEAVMRRTGTKSDFDQRNSKAKETSEISRSPGSRVVEIYEYDAPDPAVFAYPKTEHGSSPPGRGGGKGWTETYEYEPHLSKDPAPSPRKTSRRSASPRPVKGRAAGDIGSERFITEPPLVYNCEVRNRKASKKPSKSLFKRFSGMFF